MCNFWGVIVGRWKHVSRRKLVLRILVEIKGSISHCTSYTKESAFIGK